jgi:hypothetical protein
MTYNAQLPGIRRTTIYSSSRRPFAAGRTGAADVAFRAGRAPLLDVGSDLDSGGLYAELRVRVRD